MLDKDRAGVKFLFAVPKWKFGRILVYLPRCSVSKFKPSPGRRRGINVAPPDFHPPRQSGLDRHLKKHISKVDGFSRYCCTIVHGGAAYLPDFLEYLGDQHPTMSIKHGIMGHNR